MNTLAQLAPGDALVRTAVGVIAQVTFVVMCSAFAARLWFARNAATRHGLWLGTLVWVLLSPAIGAIAGSTGIALVAVALPSLSAEVSVTSDPIAGSSQGQTPPAESSDSRAVDAPVVSESDGSGQVAASEPAQPGRVRRENHMAGAVIDRPNRLSAVLGSVVLVWIVGVGIALIRLLVAATRISGVLRAARPVEADRLVDAAGQARAILGVLELPAVVTSRGASGPFAAGVRRPCIVFPEGLVESLPCDALRDVLVHETAHVVRGDAWTGLLQRIAGALLWPHPLVHYLSAQLDRAREEVCDNYVLRGADACSYSRNLLALTELCRPPGSWHAGLGLLADRWTLADRITGLLDPGRVAMTKSTPRTKLLLAVLLVAMGAVVASIRFEGSASADEPEKSARPQPPVIDASGNVAWSIKGIVVDEQGGPVAGALVRPSGVQPELKFRAGTSAADGSFTLGMEGFSFMWGLLAEVDNGSRAGLARFDDALGFIDRDQPIRIIIKATRPVAVRVKDGAGMPVAGASVVAIDVAYQAEATTGRDGIATMRIPADAHVAQIAGRKSGVGFDYFENYHSWPVDDYPPLPAEVVLTLDGAQTIAIKAIDSTARPLPSVRFRARSILKPGKRQPLQTVRSESLVSTTNEQGVAVFDWLPKSARDFFFNLQSPEYYSSTPDEHYLSGGPTELTARLLRATRLSGVVRLPDGSPARGIPVRAIGFGGRVGPLPKATLTQDNGAYSLDVMPGRAYVVGIVDANWAAPTRAGILVREGQPQSGVDFRLVKGTVLRGQVTEGPNHTPSKRVKVSLIEEGFGLPQEFRTGRPVVMPRPSRADEQGRFRFQLAPGHYKIAVLDSEPLAIEVTDQPEIVRDIALSTSTKSTFLQGVVVAKTPAGERPVPNAMIFTLQVGQYGGALAKADERGQFRSLKRPATVVYASGAVDGEAFAGFTPVADNAADFRVVISRAVKATGRVVDGNANPLARQYVMVQLDFGSDPSKSAHFRIRVNTDERGRFSWNFPVGIEGEFSVAHMKGGRPTGARTVVPFQVPTTENIEVTDLIVPAN